MKIYALTDDINSLKLNNKTLNVFEKIYDILKLINNEDIDITSKIEIDEEKNFISIRLKPRNNDKIPISIDIFDMYIDVFVDNEEFFIQRKVDNINEVVDELKSVLKSQVEELKIVNNEGKVNTRILHLYLENNQTIGKIGKQGVRNPFSNYQKQIRMYDAWLST